MRKTTPNKKIVMILSTGQLIPSSFWDSVHAFTCLSIKHGRFPVLISYPYYFLRTIYKYVYDLWFGKQIEKYKRGDLTTDDFIDFLKDQFGHNISPEELVNAWNAMSTIKKEGANNIGYIPKLIPNLFNEIDFEMVIVSATNELHSRHVKKQLQELHLESYLNSKIKFFESFLCRKLSFKDLVSTALSKYQPGTIVYSCHNAVTKDVVGNNFIYIKDELPQPNLNLGCALLFVRQVIAPQHGIAEAMCLSA